MRFWMGVVVCGLAGCAPVPDQPIRKRTTTSLGGKTYSDREPGSYPYPEQIRRLKNGMSKRDVYVLLGEPRRREEGRRTVWRYGSPKRRELIVVFLDGRLTGF